MNTEEALRYISTKDNGNDSVKEEVKDTVTESLPETAPEAEAQQPDTTKEAEDTKVDDVQPEVKVKSNDLEQAKGKDGKKNPEISKRDYAFIRERSKHKAQIEQKDKRIKELEEIVAKFKDLKPEHFRKKDGDDIDYEAYTNYRFEQRDWMDEINQRKREIDEIQKQEVNAENSRREELSFPDPVEREEYRKILSTDGPAFISSLEKYGLKDTVLGYLGRIERYPLVFKRLLTDDDAVRKVFRDHDPDVIKLRLAELAEDTLYGHKEEVQAQPQQPKIPVIGRQITTTPASEPTVRDRAYWNNYILKTRGH